MNREYSENVMVRDEAGELLEELGWTVIMAQQETFGRNGTFGRESARDTLLPKYFHPAMTRLNPWMTEPQIREAAQILERYLSTASLLQINEEKYALLRDGIPITVRRRDGTTEERRAMLIDFLHPERNHFLAVKELWMQGPLHRRRADIVGFVNGIPLIFVELKRYDVDVRNAYTDNYTDYLDTVPRFFHTNAFIILSNGEESRVGTLGSRYEFFHEWKRLSQDASDKGSVALETMLRGMCAPSCFLDIFENFILFDHSGGTTAKILARNHQYLGVNAAIQAYKERELRHGKLGVFWHTQGSGKSYSMAFLSQKIRRKFSGSPTIVVLTDRDELNTQISGTFEMCGLLGAAKASQFIASSGEDLLEKLHGNPGYIFTLIQKFNQPDAEPIYPDHDVLILSDEAHRSQYGKFAENMLHLLPTASRIGFTGTPLLGNDQLTVRTFGDYISIYNFQQAIDDGATVPLYYENRSDRLGQWEKPEITDQILEAIEEADLDVSQTEKLEREFAREIHILTAEPRLRAVAQDFVRHYSDLWTSGKAMFVCLDKITCVRMYNFVQEYWQQEIAAEKKRCAALSSDQEAQELKRKIRWMEETEMAVVVSQEQNEIRRFRKWGLDILPHREKMEKRNLAKEFKDRNNPFRVVFVCAMWLTGFDVKCLSCLYLDKPLKAHTLMQAIARANRVDEGKSNGLIIDYIGIVKQLQQALAAYASSSPGTPGPMPAIDKAQLIDRLKSVLHKAEEFLSDRGFSLSALVEASGFQKLALVQEGANAVCGTISDKKTYQTYAGELSRLSRFADRDDIDRDTRRRRDAVLAIDGELRKKRLHADTTDLMVRIHRLIDDQIYVVPQAETEKESRRFDISKIDFSRLQKKFAASRNKNLLMRDLEETIQQELDRMLFNNPNRIDYYRRYQEIIDDYNKEQDRASIEKTFKDLLELVDSLNQEQNRYVREGFQNDEELALYDMLFRSDLSPQNVARLKKISADLLAKVKAQIAQLDHWQDKPETRAIVQNVIRYTLYETLPEQYTDMQVDACRDQIYEYVYTRYAQ